MKSLANASLNPLFYAVDLIALNALGIDLTPTGVDLYEPTVAILGLSKESESLLFIDLIKVDSHFRTRGSSFYLILTDSILFSSAKLLI